MNKKQLKKIKQKLKKLEMEKSKHIANEMIRQSPKGKIQDTDKKKYSKRERRKNRVKWDENKLDF